MAKVHFLALLIILGYAQAKSIYITNKILSSNNKIKSTWEIINRISGRSKTFSEPLKLVRDNILLTSGQDVVNSFEDYFSHIAVKITSTFNSSPVDAVNVLKNNVCYCDRLFKFYYVNTNDILKVLRNIHFQIQGSPTIGTPQPAIIEDVRQDSRIVAGWEAYDGQIPHQVSLRMVGETGGVSACGGSTIHHEWVLTAAHCLANRVTFVVRLGLTNLTRPEYLVETTMKYIHPKYNEISAGVQTDDIALLRLEQSIPYGKFIQPCRMQNSEEKNTDYTGIRLTVSGYGRTDDLWNGGALSEKLLWVFLLGISNEECKRWYPASTVISEETICAASYNDTAQSSCQGDSGGPLTAVDVDGNPTIVGIVSFGSSAGCNSPYPAGYVRPGHYHEWFQDVTGINFDWKNSDLEPVNLDFPRLG